MDIWNIITTVVLTLLSIFLAYQSRQNSLLKKAESENRTLELNAIKQEVKSLKEALQEGFKRIHNRIDQVEDSNEAILSKLVDGDTGVFVRLTKDRKSVV